MREEVGIGVVEKQVVKDVESGVHVEKDPQEGLAHVGSGNERVVLGGKSSNRYIGSSGQATTSR